MHGSNHFPRHISIKIDEYGVLELFELDKVLFCRREDLENRNFKLHTEDTGIFL